MIVDPNAFRGAISVFALFILVSGFIVGLLGMLAARERNDDLGVIAGAAKLVLYIALGMGFLFLSFRFHIGAA